MKATELLLTDAYVMLTREVKSHATRDIFFDAFLSWLLPTLITDSHRQDLANTLVTRTGGTRSYHDVSALGFLVAGATNTMDRVVTDALGSGLTWVSKRSAYCDGVPTAICTDGIAMLGVALGTQRASSTTVREATSRWIARVASDTASVKGLSVWQKTLFGASRSMSIAPSQSIETVTDLQDAADIAVMLYSKKLPSPITESTYDDTAVRALDILRNVASGAKDQFRMAISVAAYEWIRKTASPVAIRRPTVQDVMELLSRLEMSFLRWTWEDKPKTSRKNAVPQKWQIENEYHVQNLLWFMLAPIFPDLQEEEYLKSLGQLQPRTDLSIPSLRLIVEVKFMYSGTSPQEMIEQIAADASLYLSDGSGFETILPVIWDDSVRVEEHQVMSRGLSQLRGVVSPVILCKPSFMRKQPGPA